MVQTAILGEIIDRISELDSEDTIYASKPWAKESAAIVMREPDTGGLPKGISEAGLTYFLEVFIAQDVVEDLLASSNGGTTSQAICQRLIDYAINDA